MAAKVIVRAVSGIIFLLMISPNVHATHAWNNYHWARSENPIPLTVVDSVTGDWQSEFETSIDEWNFSTALDLSPGAADDASRTRKQCKAVAGQIRVCNAAYGFNLWLGMASINLDSNGHITKGTAKVNDSYASYWDDPYEKRHVMCQETGHLFGLGHTSEDGSSQRTCMDYSSDPASISPNQHDYDLLANIYAHLDSIDDGTVSDPKPCRGRKCPNFGEPEIPPMGLRVHKGQNHEIWVARGRADTLWIHHVRLVPEEYR